MKRTAKWAIGLFLGLILGVPAALGLVMWNSFHKFKMRQSRQAEGLVAEFHRRYNADDFDPICSNAYKCGEFANVKDGWQHVLEETRNRGGAFKNVVRSHIEVSVEPPSIRADVVSAFEKGELREVFTMNDFDGTLKIATYGIVFTP